MSFLGRLALRMGISPIPFYLVLGLAFGQLVAGPLSDRFGRRPVILTGLATYIVASIGCAFAAEAGHLVLPVTSHIFWVPLPTALGAAGIALLGGLLGDFRAAQALVILVALFIPVVAWAAALRLGAGETLALAAGALAGLGGLFAPGLVDVDAYAPAAVLGTLFFLAYARAASGDVRAGATAGLLVGLLYLTRSEGALFGLALLALLLAPRTRRAGLAGSAAALVFGVAWLARDVAAGAPPDLLARTALLVRYDQFFAIASPTWSAFVSSLDVVLVAKAAALVTNAVTLVFVFALVLLVPGIADQVEEEQGEDVGLEVGRVHGAAKGVRRRPEARREVLLGKA